MIRANPRMNDSQLIDKALLESARTWFQGHFRRRIVGPIESLFPNYALPNEIREVLDTATVVFDEVGAWSGQPIDGDKVRERLSKHDPRKMAVFKQVMLLYRRHCAVTTEGMTEKTFHLGLTETLEKELKDLDTLVGADWFQAIKNHRLPRLKDFLPV